MGKKERIYLPCVSVAGSVMKKGELRITSIRKEDMVSAAVRYAADASASSSTASEGSLVNTLALGRDEREIV